MLETLLDDLKAAAAGPDPKTAVETVLGGFVADPAAAKAALPSYDEDDVILFEDESLSVWFCRFQPGMTVPPHDHRMTATIGVIEGVERNDFYERDGRNPPVFSHSTPVGAGAVVQIAADAIHGVTCTSPEPSEAIHVYLGALSRVDRSLFDPAGGAEMPFTDENYHRLTAAAAADE